ncbi:hypothetical protein ACFLQI_02755 [Candidatus Undinarchaeota archaeon]
MKFFEITFIPSHAKAFEIIGDILTDIELVKEVNDELKETGTFLANIRVMEQDVPKGAEETDEEGKPMPTKKFNATVVGSKKKFLKKQKIDVDVLFTVIAGKGKEGRDTIIVEGDEDHADVARTILGHLRTKILPNVDPLGNVTVVSSRSVKMMKPPGA